MREQRKRGFSIKPEGLALIEQTMKDKGYSRQQLADAVAEFEGYLSIDTINRLLRGEKTQRKTIEAIAKALDLKPTDFVEHSEWFPPSSTAAQEKTAASEINIDWRQVCHRMLKEQQDKQRLRRQATEMGFEVNVHVPLGLVERKQQQRRNGNVELSQLYQLDQEVIAKTYQHDDFLTEVIGQKQARKNKNIAIVGEPGAGKTTLLGAIASFIQSNTEDLPICITLASLQGRTIEDYLLKTWLSEAMGLVNPQVVITPEIENELIKQFRQGGVWLLLDGVDEMVADSPVQALTTIQKQLIDWLGQVRVGLTCRVNVWDVSVNNILTGFDTYRTQEFTHKQIDQFIQDWFACAGKLDRSKQLQAKLKEPGRERLYDLVKHPLRLALLCQTLYLDEEDFADTKAGIYQRFTRYFYEWKQNLRPKELINQDELKKELHQALGKLALAGINSAARFRLSQGLACQEMGEQLFKLACDIGWLNLVERDAQTDEPVYAFFHPTFQEYFAALAIDDWRYFLNHVPDNPGQGTYHIFEPQWKEVILLWLGRDDVLMEQKNEFIKALMKFEDEYQDDFYGCRAYFLAAAGLAEFKDCFWGDEIIERLLEWSFGYFNVQQQKWLTFIDPLKDGARAILAETERSMAIVALVRLIESIEYDHLRLEIAYILGKIDLGNETALTTLLQLIHSTTDELTSALALWNLWAIGFGNETYITSLVQILHSTEDEELRNAGLCFLCITFPGNQELVAILEQLLQSTEDQETRKLAITGLWIVDPGSQEAITALVQLIQSTDNENIRRQGFKKLFIEDIGFDYTKLIANFDNTKTIAELIKILQSIEDENIRRQIAEILGIIDKGNSLAIASLAQIIQTSEDRKNRELAVFSLWSIDPINPVTLAALAQLIRLTEDENIRRQAAESLGKADQGNREAIAALVQLIRSAKDNNIRRQAAESLGKIDNGNPIAIDTLIQLIQSTDDDIRRQAFDSLQTIGTGNEVAITGLVQLIQSSQDEGSCWRTFYALEKIGVGNEVAITALVQLIYSTQNEYIFKQSVDVLGEIGRDNPEAIAALNQLMHSNKNGLRLTAASNLKKILPEEQLPEIVALLRNYFNYLSNKSECSEDDSKRLNNCYQILLECAQILPYPTFYQAWHSERPFVEALENQFTDIASQVQPTEKTYTIVINAQALEGETDTSAIAQELCNQIYLTAFPDELEIPEVSNAPQLKRLIPQIKKQLQKQNLALILDKCEPNQAQVTFCRKITDVVHIAWITNQPLEAPLKGFLPEQANLLSAIQSWIDEIG